MMATKMTSMVSTEHMSYSMSNSVVSTVMTAMMSTVMTAVMPTVMYHSGRYMVMMRVRMHDCCRRYNMAMGHGCIAWHRRRHVRDSMAMGWHVTMRGHMSMRGNVAMRGHMSLRRNVARGSLWMVAWRYAGAWWVLIHIYYY